MGIYNPPRKIPCDICGKIRILNYSNRCTTCKSCSQKKIKPKTKIKKICKFCLTEFKSGAWANRIYCSFQCYLLAYSGKRQKDKNPSWKGGISIQKYPRMFNKNLKLKIRQRDNFQCMLCGKTEIMFNRKMSIHHIDYNKENCDINNLICLCHLCHPKTNINREYYTQYFKSFFNLGE